MRGGREQRAWECLTELWRGLRDGADEHALVYVRGAIDFALHAGLLTAEEHELWHRRLPTCPGHDDEGGRDWCAYCGTMPATPEAG